MGRPAIATETAENGPQPLPEGADVVIEVNRRAGTAPAGFFFSARVTGPLPETEHFDPYFDLHYRWTFSDPGWYTRHDTEDLPWGQYYSVDGKPVLVEAARPPEGKDVRFLGNDRDIAYGPHCVHVFAPSPSDFGGRDFLEYTVTCEIRTRGSAPLVRSAVVVVDNPDRVFAGHATICVSPSGRFDGAPPGALQLARYSDAVREAENVGEDVRILLRRGESHEMPLSGKEAKRKGGFRRLHHGVFPAEGEDFAEIGPSTLRLKARREDGETAFWGLRKRGGYDPTDPWRTPTSGTGNGVVIRDGAYHTLWDCVFEGCETGLSAKNDTQNLVIGNVLIRDWFNYGIFLGRGTGQSGCCGTWIKQNPRTVIGGGKGEEERPFYADHGPFRCSATTGPIVFNLCDLRSANSWIGYYQPNHRILRMPQNPDDPTVEEGVVERVRGETGATLMTAAGPKMAVARRYLFDKVYSVEANQAGEFASVIGAPAPGMRFRNCIAVLPDTPRVGGGRLRYWLRRSGSFNGDHVSIGRLGIDIYNCTLVDLRNAKHASGGMELVDTESVKAFNYVDFENNVFWVPVPERSDTATGDAPLDMDVLWAVTNPGMKWETDPFQEIYGFAPGSAARYAPLPGSPAIGSADPSARIAVDDFFGRLRPADASRGAVEPG